MLDAPRSVEQIILQSRSHGGPCPIHPPWRATGVERLHRGGRCSFSFLFSSRSYGAESILQDVFQDQRARWPSGYIFSIAPDGSWQLFSATFKRPIVTLGGGATQIDRTQWHHLGLRFDGKHVEGMFDGKTLVSTDDTAHTHGMFALGTEWDHTQFDNLSVTTK